MSEPKFTGLLQAPLSEVGTLWPVLKPWFLKVHPTLLGDVSEAKMTQMLTDLMSGRLVLWIAYVDGAAVGAVVTEIIGERTGTRNLWIQSFFMSPKTEKNIIDVGMNALKVYAKQNKCARVVAFTASPAVISIVKRLGGDTSQRFVQMEV